MEASGKSYGTIAGGAILILKEEKENLKIYLRKVAEAVGVSKVTLSNFYESIKKYK